jgi:hypothetical protein
MNPRIATRTARLAQILERAFQQQPESFPETRSQPRHAEHLLAAGFGYYDAYAYRAAANARTELCQGYYIQDSRTIVARMLELGYKPALAQACVDFFAQALTNYDDFTRADLMDDLHLPKRLTIGETDELMNNDLFSVNLVHDVLRDESHLWQVLAGLGVDVDGETSDNVRVALQLPPDFPAQRHLQASIDIPFTAVYDLEQGEAEEALFYGTNRRLGVRGNLRLRPSGKRGWAYPTLQIDEHPYLDDRTQSERLGAFPRRALPALDGDQFDSGAAAARAGLAPATTASFDYLAGWIMDANGVNGIGHMSTGQIEKAFLGALANARTVAVADAHLLAAQACRSLASRRVIRDLEELIAVSAGRIR